MCDAICRQYKLCYGCYIHAEKNMLSNVQKKVRHEINRIRIALSVTLQIDRPCTKLRSVNILIISSGTVGIRSPSVLG